MLYWRIRECREYQARSRYTSSEESLDRPNRRNDAHCRSRRLFILPTSIIGQRGP